jgi:hypothetical protein
MQRTRCNGWPHVKHVHIRAWNVERAAISRRGRAVSLRREVARWALCTLHSCSALQQHLSIAPKRYCRSTQPVVHVRASARGSVPSEQVTKAARCVQTGPQARHGHGQRTRQETPELEYKQSTRCYRHMCAYCFLACSLWCSVCREQIAVLLRQPKISDNGHFCVMGYVTTLIN